MGGTEDAQELSAQPAMRLFASFFNFRREARQEKVVNQPDSKVERSGSNAAVVNVVGMTQIGEPLPQKDTRGIRVAGNLHGGIQ